ncbi:MAG: hypothetical protein J7621_22955 [Niastella sp.]|nr:hypothetical protein [Niastella sp.]
MRLTKAKLLSKVREGLRKLEYKEVNDPVTAAEGLFVKNLSSGFFITLGFTISRFYDSRFTADFYLSKTTIWAATWGDIPLESYKRVGAFLTSEERALFLDTEYGTIEGGDAWWSGDNIDSFNNFLEAVKITEGRFLAQGDLFIKVEESTEVQELVDHVSGLFAVIDNGVDNSRKYQFVPDKKLGDIPEEWFKAAEITLSNKNAILNKNTIKRLAADAWRQKVLK